MSAKTAIVGDVHGLLGSLKALVARLDLRGGDTLVFVGDLVDKGPDPAGTVAYAAQLKASAAFDVILVEGNHEDKHRRYRRNLTERPKVAREQAAGDPQLAALTQALGPEALAFLEGAEPFWRVETQEILVVHGGIPGDMTDFPTDYTSLFGKARQKAGKILRTRFIEKTTGAFLALGKEQPGDPFWAQVYDGRFGHVVFGHQPFMDGPAEFTHATGIDTGAVHGGPLTALVLEEGGSRSYVQVPGEAAVSFKRDPMFAADLPCK